MSVNVYNLMDVQTACQVGSTTPLVVANADMRKTATSSNTSTGKDVTVNAKRNAVLKTTPKTYQIANAKNSA